MTLSDHTGGCELLSVEEMGRADAFAVRAGVSEEELMENAGRAVAEEIRRRWLPRPAVVLCGPGNNGGDGFVAARHLSEMGWDVSVQLLGSRDKLKGEAAKNAARWTGTVGRPDPAKLAGSGLIVDALFGAGLTRGLSDHAVSLAKAASDLDVPVVAIDLPSGLAGDTGCPIGDSVFRADLTVTFFRKKPAHLLYPGRRICGEVVIADIGIPSAALSEIAPKTWENHPALWRGFLPLRRSDTHKYSFGHALIYGGRDAVGAARLAASAALRGGAGLVTLAAAHGTRALYAGAPASLILVERGPDDSFHQWLEDRRRNAVLIGPGAGVNEATRKAALAALASGRACVLDADAITIFENDPTALFEARRGPLVLTPHNGEFKRVFPNLEGDRLIRARAAARHSGAVVLVKGADSVVASPDGRAVIAGSAPADLATAGTGDVLAGLLTGLIAQGMEIFEASAAALWMHSEAARVVGPALIADDLLAPLQEVRRRLLAIV